MFSLITQRTQTRKRELEIARRAEAQARAIMAQERRRTATPITPSVGSDGRIIPDISDVGSNHQGTFQGSLNEADMAPHVESESMTGRAFAKTLKTN